MVSIAGLKQNDNFVDIATYKEGIIFRMGNLIYTAR